MALRPDYGRVAKDGHCRDEPSQAMCPGIRLVLVPSPTEAWMSRADVVRCSKNKEPESKKKRKNEEEKRKKRIYNMVMYIGWLRRDRGAEIQRSTKNYSRSRDRGNDWRCLMFNSGSSVGSQRRASWGDSGEHRAETLAEDLWCLGVSSQLVDVILIFEALSSQAGIIPL